MKYVLHVLLSLIVLSRSVHADGTKADLAQARSLNTSALHYSNARLEPDAKSQEILRKFNLDYSNAVSSGDPGNLAEYYNENVRLMPEYQKTVLGRANAMAYHRAFFGRFQLKNFSRDKKIAMDLGTRVVEVGVFEMTLVFKSTGQSHTFAGKYLDLWSKSEAGPLSLLTSAWNYNLSLAIADDLKFPEVPAVQMALQPHVIVKGGISFELAALNKLLEAAISQHDGPLWSQFFADDAVLAANYRPLLLNRAAVDGYLESHVKELPIFEKLDIRNDLIDDLGQYVIEYATHIANWRNGDSSGVSTGKNMRIWRRDPNGALKLFILIGGYD